MAKKPFIPLHEQVANQLIKKLEEGTAPWQLPWDNSGTPAQLPYNAVTGNRYKGINCLSLMLAGREDPRWLTFRQALSKGWNVRRGEKARLIQFVKTSEFVPKIDGQGNKRYDSKGKPEGIIVPLERPILSSAWVFNAQQIQGIPILVAQDREQQRWNPIERAEKLLVATGAKINYVPGEKAFYNPMTDEITLPLASQFPAAHKFYETALHETAHWSGHSSRLDRRVMNQVGSPAYAREELRAEIASMLIGSELKIGHDPEQHAAYVNSWVRTLRDTPAEIFAAATDAERIFDYIMAFERLYDRSQEKASSKAELSNDSGQQKIGELLPGQQVNYHNTTYKVTGMLKRGRIQLEDLSSGVTIAVNKDDHLYQRLLAVANNQNNKENATEQASTQQGIGR